MEQRNLFNLGIANRVGLIPTTYLAASNAGALLLTLSLDMIHPTGTGASKLKKCSDVAIS